MAEPDPDMNGVRETPGPDEPLWNAEQRRAGAARAQNLKVQAADGGLRFQAYLPSDLATWLLDLIERGVFKDPSEAVFVLLGEMRELFEHPDLRKDLFARSLEAAANDPRPAIPAEVVFAEIGVMLKAPRPAAVVWASSLTPVDGDSPEQVR